MGQGCWDRELCAAQLLSSVRMTRSSLVRTRFFSASRWERSIEKTETSAQQRKEKEKDELVKRDSIPQSPCWKSHSGDELDWQEQAARHGTGAVAPSVWELGSGAGC